MKSDNVYAMPYPSTRQVVYGKGGMVCSSQQLASLAGAQILQRGGNAIDAALATAAALTVVEPTSNGIGGDCFALVWSGGKLEGLNASGPAPAAINAAHIRSLGYSEMPDSGWIPITVPGQPAGWAALSERYGKLPLIEVLQPAISYALNGYPVGPVCAIMWGRQFERFQKELTPEQFADWCAVFAPNGSAPKSGDLWRSPLQAQTLKEIGETEAESFYRGEIANKIVAHAVHNGGYLRESDLAAYRTEWVNPISVDYKGYQVYEIPPNGHGMVALMALKLLSAFTFTEKDSVETLHRQIECMKLAYIDGKTFIADPRYMKASVADMLSSRYADERRGAIGESALEPVCGKPYGSDTVYFCAADEEGNMVSMIQSNYKYFGSGIVVPGTGIALHDRGANFSLDEKSPNSIAPGKKPYHTIIPGFLCKDGRPCGPFGVMGGFMQPQGHVQVIMNMVDFGLNPQQTLNALRWQWVGGKHILVEPGFDPSLAEGLRSKGHEVEYAEDCISFGRGQIIMRCENGAYMGGTEPRVEGACLGL